MKETVAKLKKARLTVLLANLIYFLAVLALGFLIFVKGRGGLLYGLVAAALAAYLALIRPLTVRYKRTAREGLLRENVCRGMSDFTYLPKAGFTAQEFQEAGLMAGDTGKAFLSRELVTTCQGGFRLKMADVTFPVRKDGLNAMFNGMLLHITGDSATFPELRLTSGEKMCIRDRCTGAAGHLRALCRKREAVSAGRPARHRQGSLRALYLYPQQVEAQLLRHHQRRRVDKKGLGFSAE